MRAATRHGIAQTAIATRICAAADVRLSSEPARSRFQTAWTTALARARRRALVGNYRWPASRVGMRARLGRLLRVAGARLGDELLRGDRGVAVVLVVGDDEVRDLGLEPGVDRAGRRIGVL